MAAATIVAVTIIPVIMVQPAMGQSAYQIEADAKNKGGWDAAITAQISTDWLYHGVTESMNRPTLGFSIEVQEADLPWYVGLELHRSKATRDSERHESYSVYAGADFEPLPGWLTGISIKAVQFPDADREWDYAELGFQAHHHSGWSLQLDASDDYYHRGTAAWFAAVSYSGVLTEAWYYQVGVRRGEFEADRWPDYTNPFLLLGFGQGLMNVNLTYDYNDQGGEQLFNDELETSTWSLRMLYRLR